MTMALTVLHAGGKFGGGGYKVSGGLHGVGVSVVNALSSQPRRRGAATAATLWRAGVLRSAYPDDAAASEVRDLEEGEGTGTTVTCYASTDIFETTTYSLETITNRFREMAFLNKGLEIVVRDERPDAERGRRRGRATTPSATTSTRPTPARSSAPSGGLEQVFKYDRGLVDYVEHLNRAQDHGQPDDHLASRPRPRTTSESHMSLEVAMQWNTGYNESVHTFANTINTHEGGTHEEGFRSALTSLVNDWGEEWGLIKKREDRVSRRRHPRGPDRDHLDQARRAAVRGPDQDQARQHRGQGLRAADRQRPARRLARAEPGRGQGHRPQVAGRGDRPDRRPQGARPGPLAARACSAAAACPASCRTASRPTPRSARSSSSRVTRPAARPGRAATRGSRRSSRSAARSSTSRRRASTRCSPTPRSRRSSPRSAPASTRSSTSRSCATTRSC